MHKYQPAHWGKYLRGVFAHTLTGQTEGIAIVVADGGNGGVRVVLHHAEHITRHGHRHGARNLTLDVSGAAEMQFTARSKQTHRRCGSMGARTHQTGCWCWDLTLTVRNTAPGQLNTKISAVHAHARALSTTHTHTLVLVAHNKTHTHKHNRATRDTNNVTVRGPRESLTTAVCPSWVVANDCGPGPRAGGFDGADCADLCLVVRRRRGCRSHPKNTTRRYGNIGIRDCVHALSAGPVQTTAAASQRQHKHTHAHARTHMQSTQ